MNNWYKKIKRSDKSLEQGDIIYRCPIIILPKELKANQEYRVKVDMYDVIIMSQSCDLEQNKLEIVLVCPFIRFEDYVKNAYPNTNKKNGIFDKIKKGEFHNYHLLNKSEYFEVNDFIMVDFTSVYGVHIDYLKEHISKQKNRPRLISPYKEHLSQAFARFFMRVGLPTSLTYNN
jgi:hypothetical protein